MKTLDEYYFDPRYLLTYLIISTICIILILFPGPQTYSESMIMGNSSMNLSNTKFDSINPYFSVSNNSIFSVWVSNLGSNNSEVMFKKMDEKSKSFGSAVNISNATGISNLAKLTNSDNNIYVTWEDKQTDNWKLLFSKSEDKGAQFGAITNLSNSTGNVHLHDLSASGKNVFVLWAANENISSSNKEIFFRKSQDDGDSFGDVINLSKDIDDSLDPHMVINQNGAIIYIVWTKCDTKHDDPDCHVVFTRSLDQGNSFTDSKIIDAENLLPQGSNSSNSTSGNVIFNSNSNVFPSYLLDNSTMNDEISAINPIIFTSLEGKQVYILWEQSTFGKGDSEIYLKSSNDYGNSFDSSINISNSSGTSRLAHGSIFGEDLYVTWADTLNQNGTFDIMFAKIDANNQRGKVIDLSNNSGNSVSPFLWISDNDLIYVIWSDSTNDSSVLLTTIDPSGPTFTREVLKSGHTEVFTNPRIIETEDKLWISWTESNNIINKIVLIDHEK